MLAVNADLWETCAVIEYQRLILADSVRNTAFEQALRAVIVPGKTTLADLGSGTGFLSFLARKLGAKQCTLVEQSLDLLNLSKKLGKENGLTHCEYVHAHSQDIDLQKPVDVVVSETLSNFGLEEHVIETMQDARRMLKPGGVQIPQRLTEFVCPIVSDRLWRELSAWERIGHDLHFAAAQEVSVQNSYVRTLQPKDMPTQDWAHIWDEIDLTEDASPIRKRNAEWNTAADMTVYGVALWWDCELVPGVHISTSPHENATHWEQIYLPVHAPLQLKKGDVFACSLYADTRRDKGLDLRWEFTHERAGKILAKQKSDIRRGYIAR